MIDKEKLIEDEKLHGKWFILYGHISDPIKFEDLKQIHAPFGQFYADPFSVKEGDLHYIFFELFDYKKGSLAYFTVDKNLNHSEPKPIQIDINPHTSYPHVFKHDGIYYMIPETCHLDKINLYQCVSFPDKWELKTTLINNIHSGDNTLLYKDNKWWLFCMVYHNGENKFCIFYSDNLFDGWKEHNIINTKNPKLDNNSVTRSAGRIFSFGGKTYRPAQYSDRGINGEGVVLYEIIELTATTYKEKAVNIISRSDFKDIRAMHTFSVNDGLMLLDARTERLTDHPFHEINKDETLEQINNKNKYD